VGAVEDLAADDVAAAGEVDRERLGDHGPRPGGEGQSLHRPEPRRGHGEGGRRLNLLGPRRRRCVSGAATSTDPSVPIVIDSVLMTLQWCPPG